MQTIGDLLPSLISNRNILIFYRKVEQKPSQSFFELRKRELMNVNEVKKIIRNPIVNENCNNMVPLRIRQVYFNFFG